VTAVSRTARLSAERDAPTDTQRSCMTHDGKSDSAALIKKVALLEHCELADSACAGRDPHALTGTLAELVHLAPESMVIELTAFCELSRYDPELAFLRWPHVRRQLLEKLQGEPPDGM